MAMTQSKPGEVIESFAPIVSTTHFSSLPVDKFDAVETEHHLVRLEQSIYSFVVATNQLQRRCRHESQIDCLID